MFWCPTENRESWAHVIDSDGFKQSVVHSCRIHGGCIYGVHKDGDGQEDDEGEKGECGCGASVLSRPGS